jgi:AhpD family alkylhydroperoxidase
MVDSGRLPKTRLDTADDEALTALAGAGAAAFGHTATLTIDRQVAQLLRLRVAQLNHCTYCLLVHHAAAREAAIPQAKVETLSAWWETQLFTAPERAALRYAEVLTLLADATAAQQFQPVHDELAAHFPPDQITEIVGVVVNMNIWTRLKLAEGVMPAAGA